MLYLKRVEIENLRCFESVEIDFEPNSTPLQWSMFTGDNATGKSTLLKAIALGLCDESSAAGLLRESDTGYVRRKKRRATITLHLIHSEDSNKEYRIETTIEKMSKRTYALESLTQQHWPKGASIWNEIFACGYGAGRGTSGTGDIGDYAAINAVYSLFNYSEGLQNPELALRRIPTAEQRGTPYEILQHILKVNLIRLASASQAYTGVAVRGPWGRSMPLRDLADGYKTTFLWVTDFLGWAIMYRPNQRPADIAGIVMVDELEQHLHPKWQREIVQLLRESFPRVQFITTTHSPIVAGSIGDAIGDNQDQLLHLSPNPEDRSAVSIDTEDTMKGWQADQVLASPAFDWLVDDNEDVEFVLRRASELFLRGSDRSAAEQLEYETLRTHLEEILPEGRTPIERDIQRERDQTLATEMANLRMRARRLSE